MALFEAAEKAQQETQEIRETKALISQSYASREADLERRLREAQKALSEYQMTVIMQIDQVKERYHQREISLIKEAHKAELSCLTNLATKESMICELKARLEEATTRISSLESKLLRLARIESDTSEPA